MLSGIRSPTEPKPVFVLANLSMPFFLISALCSFYLGPLAMALILMIILLQVIVAVGTLDMRHKIMPYLFVLWVASVLSALYVGSRNYHKTYAPYRLADKGRDRSVPANAAASGYLDGRTLSFDSSFVLDDVRAVGYRAFGNTYCAAPVVSLGAPEAVGDYPVVQFWAVGQDCCGARGDFVCDDAGEVGVHGGIVMHDPSEAETLMGTLLSPRQFQEGWHRAIEASCALHEMTSARDPVLILWVKRPGSVLELWHSQAILWWVVSSVAHLILASFAWGVLLNLFKSQKKTRYADHL